MEVRTPWRSRTKYFSRGLSVEYPLGGQLTADKRLVGPVVSPLAVPTTVGYTYLIQETVNDLERRCAIVIEDDVAKRRYRGVGEEDVIILSNETTTAKIGDHRFDAVFS